MAVMERSHDTAETSNKPRAISVNNVLFATDFSPTSQSALPYATAICRHFGSTLHVAHVLSDANLLLMTGGVDYVCVDTVYEDAHNEAQEKIHQITACLEQIPCRTYLRHGQVWTNLSSIVAANEIDLIVVGTHGRSGLGTLLLGSVAEEILRHAPCPVLTIGPRVCAATRLPDFYARGRELAPVDLELQNILLATSLTPASLTVAPVAIALASEFDARLTLMHVFEQYPNLQDQPNGDRPNEDRPNEDRPNEDRLNEDRPNEDRLNEDRPIKTGFHQLQALVPNDPALAYAPEIVIEFGSVSHNILNAAAQRDADLIVLGAHPANHSTHLPWSTVHQVVAYATCPVLTVRSE